MTILWLFNDVKVLLNRDDSFVLFVISRRQKRQAFWTFTEDLIYTADTVRALCDIFSTLRFQIADWRVDIVVVSIMQIEMTVRASYTNSTLIARKLTLCKIEKIFHNSSYLGDFRFRLNRRFTRRYENKNGNFRRTISKDK